VSLILITLFAFTVATTHVTLTPAGNIIAIANTTTLITIDTNMTFVIAIMIIRIRIITIATTRADTIAIAITITNAISITMIVTCWLTPLFTIIC